MVDSSANLINFVELVVIEYHRDVRHIDDDHALIKIHRHKKKTRLFFRQVKLI